MPQSSTGKGKGSRAPSGGIACILDSGTRQATAANFLRPEESVHARKSDLLLYKEANTAFRAVCRLS